MIERTDRDADVFERDADYGRRDPDTVVVRDRDVVRETDVDRRPYAARPPARRYEDEVVEERTVAAAPPPGVPTFSIAASFFGWCVASFLTIVLLTVITGSAAGILADGTLTTDEAETFGVGLSIAALVGVFIAYFAGGYTAGRIALWRGVLHGALVPVWAILVSLVLVLIAAGVGVTNLDALNIRVEGIDADQLTGASLAALVLTLAVMFGGAILGGMVGQRYDTEEYEAATQRRRARYGRGI